MSTPPSPLITLPFPEERFSFASSSGVGVAAYDWGGDGPPLVFAHATGLHAHAWLPLVASLRSSFHCYGLDARAQGDTGAGDPPDLMWGAVADDFVAVLDGFSLSGRGDVHAIGHSQGGYSIYQGELRRPGTFAHLFGYEPVTFPNREGVSMAAERDNYMAVLAAKRREVFTSRQAAYDNYKGKPPFMSIDDEALRAYVEWGFDDLDDATVRLKCRAADEAALFANSATDTFDRLPELACAVTLGLGEFTNEGFQMMVPLQAERLSRGTLVKFPGRSHFGILEGCVEMADLIRTAFAATA